MLVLEEVVFSTTYRKSREVQFAFSTNPIVGLPIALQSTIVELGVVLLLGWAEFSFPFKVGDSVVGSSVVAAILGVVLGWTEFSTFPFPVGDAVVG